MPDLTELEPLTVERPETVGDFARLALEHQAEPLSRPVVVQTGECCLCGQQIEEGQAWGCFWPSEGDMAPAHDACRLPQRADDGPTAPDERHAWGWLVVLAWLALPALVAALIWTGDQRYAWSLLPAGLAALVVHGAHAAGRSA